MEQTKQQIAKEQTLTLINKKSLTITGIEKIVSLKPDLIQLNTVFGGLMVVGSNLELIKLDNATNKIDISGNIECLKYVDEKSKQPFFRKIFKWFFQV